MKKYIISFLSILLIAITSIGGGLLLSACDNSSYSENGGGNLDNPENGSDENLDDDDLPNNPSDDEENEDNKDDVTAASDFTINLTVYTMDASGNYVTGLDRREHAHTAGSYSFGSAGFASIWLSRSNGNSSETKTAYSGSTSITWNQGWVANATANISVSLPENGYPYIGQYNEMYVLDHIQCSSCGSVNSTEHSCYIGSAAGIWGKYTTTYSVYFARKSYNIDVNILNPDGNQDFNSGTVDLRYSWNNATSNDVNDQPETSRIYADTSLIISDIKPASGYYLRGVSASRGGISNSNGTYTYKVSSLGGYKWPDSGSDFFDIVNVQMGRLTQQNINILSPSGSEDRQSGTIDVYYSFNDTRYDNVTNEPIEGTNVQDNSYIEISDIRPATGMRIESVKVGNTNITPSNGVYRIDCNASQTIVVQMAWKEYYVDVNIMSPTNVQDNASGTVDIVYSSPYQSLNDVTNEATTSLIQHGGTITISDIKPAAGMRIENVYITSGNGTLSNNNGTYTFTASSDGSHQVQWYNEIIIKMTWKEYYVGINIMSPTNVQDNASGTIDIVYSNPSQSLNDVVDEASESLIQHGGTITISDIKPATGYKLESVSLSGGNGTLTNNNGTYTFTASSDGSHQTKWYNEIIIKMTYQEYRLDVNYNVNGTWYNSGLDGFQFSIYHGDNLIGSNFKDYNAEIDFRTEVRVVASTILNGYKLSQITSPVATVQTNTLTFSMPAQDISVSIYIVSNVYTTTLKYQNGNADSTIYLKYGVGWYSNSSCTTSITNISVPSREGFNFSGFYNSSTGTGTQTINSSGEILVSNTFSTSAMEWYANWGAKNPARYDEELDKWYVEMGRYPQTSIIDSDLRNWSERNGSNFSNISYNEMTKMSTFTVTTVGVWEILTIAIPAIVGVEYTLTFDYIVPNYNRLEENLGDYGQVQNADGGLAIQIINAGGPTDSDNTGSDYLTYRLPTTEGAGTITTTFSVIGTDTNMYIAINAGYIADNQTVTFSLGNFRLSTGEVSLTTSGNTYNLPTKQLEENMTHWNKYSLNENIGTSYNYENKQSSISINTAGGWEIVGTQVQVLKNTNYTINFNMLSGATNNLSSKPRLQVLNAAPVNNDNSSTEIAYLDLVSNGSKKLTFNSGDNETLYIIINGGYLNDGSTYTFTFSDFSFKNGKQEAYGTKGYNSYILSNGEEYLRYNGNWYKVEPVKYYLSGNYSEGYATENGNITAVSEKVVFASVWNLGFVGLNGGYSSSNSTILNNHDNHFLIDSNTGWDGTVMNNDYITRKDMSWKVFTNSSGNITAQTHSDSYALPTSTIDLDEVFGEGNYQAEFSDLVSDMLGNKLMYWTRDVGSNLNNAECITRFGTVTQARMQKLLGVRITLNVKTFACV